MIVFHRFKESPHGFVAVCTDASGCSELTRKNMRSLYERARLGITTKGYTPESVYLKSILERWPDTALAKRIKAKRIKKQ